MKTAHEKKSSTTLPRRRVTWTFQPAADVQKAVEHEYGDITAERGKLTQVCNDALRRFMPEAIRTVLRFKEWPRDVTRHSAASYWLAMKHDSEYVAEQLGNSVRVLKRDYKALVTIERAQRFYGEVKPASQKRL